MIPISSFFTLPRIAFTAFIFSRLLYHSVAATDPQDVSALLALQQAWLSASLPWGGDPCEGKWLGVTCDESNSSVIELTLPNEALDGILPGDIGNLANLEILDLSLNRNLKGPLPPDIRKLTRLKQLSLQACGFVGVIPSELQYLQNLTFLALNQNFFTGAIPATIGQLTNLFWLDLSNNQLSGDLPVSRNGGGLDNLKAAGHFHLQNNNLSGNIPADLFNSDMSLIHLLLHKNSFDGPIPEQIGNLTQLKILRLDFNRISGSIPESISTLASLTSLQLNNNALTGKLPDLSSLVHLQFLNIGSNNFDVDVVPYWFSSFTNISFLAMEAGKLIGNLSAEILSLPKISQVLLGFNHINGTLDIQNPGSLLTLVDLQYSNISSLHLGSYGGILRLQGTTLCNTNSSQPDNACSPSIPPPPPETSSSSLNCQCPQGFAANPSAISSCMCAVPISGFIIFTAPLIAGLDDSIISSVQSTLAQGLNLISNQVIVSVAGNDVANISIFPENTQYWERSQANAITYLLDSQAIKFPDLGPYTFETFAPYPSQEEMLKPGLSFGVKVGIGVALIALSVSTIALSVYACVLKKKADKAEHLSKPFASWMANGGEKGDPPKLKGTQPFSYSHLRKATRNFSASNEIGVGGYGKVYRGLLASGQQVAIKKGKGSSKQGLPEFKNEIELLSRVHHKNLVSLVGFCLEERILVYEYMPNGTLRDCLSGHSGVQLDWRRRVIFALGAARGIAYLHTEANPPVIHRDIKSSNILLDDKLVAKVADFGLSRLVPDAVGTGECHVSTQVKGTLGYLDPEYFTTERLTEKSDVYSFGVVLLELLTARQPLEKGKYIVPEVKTALIMGGMDSFKALFLDPNLTDYPPGDLEKLLRTALRCVEREAASRPTMGDVVKELETLVHNTRNGTTTYISSSL